MSKVTSKLQVTLPKAIADQYGIKPGDEIDWVAAGDAIRVIPSRPARAMLPLEERLRLFDQASRRIRQRALERKGTVKLAPKDRGWKREDLYTRGRSH